MPWSDGQHSACLYNGVWWITFTSRYSLLILWPHITCRPLPSLFNHWLLITFIRFDSSFTQCPVISFSHSYSSCVTTLELWWFCGHEISLDDDVRWRWNQVHQSQARIIATPMTTRHMSLTSSQTLHPRVLSSPKDKLIQCEYPSLYSLWMKILTDAICRHPYMKQTLIGIGCGQWNTDTWARYERRRLNGTQRKMVRKTTVQWIPISPELYISKILLVKSNGRIEGIAFAWRKLGPTGCQNNGMCERRDGSNVSRKEHS